MPRVSRLKPAPVRKGEETHGQRLARLRKERGFTQKELAERTGLIQARISDYERDKLRLNADMILRFATALESKEFLKRRLEEASKFIDLDQLCLSPQCGFASTEEGNVLSEDEQWTKLRLVVELAREVWG